MHRWCDRRRRFGYGEVTAAATRQALCRNMKARGSAASRLGSRHPSMAISAADTGRERGADSTPPPSAGREAPLGPTVALAVAFAIGLFVVALGLVLIPTSPKPLPPPLTEQEQNAESA